MAIAMHKEMKGYGLTFNERIKKWFIVVQIREMGKLYLSLVNVIDQEIELS